MYINLHTHSSHSDGTLSPLELLNKAVESNVNYFSLTDHDTVSGWDELDINSHNGIKLIYGVEISTREHDYLHILAYNIDVKNVYFRNKLAEFRDRRIERIKNIINKLNKIDVSIDFDEINVDSTDTVGRPHIADILIKKGYGRTRSEVFHKYLIEGCYAYVKPMGPTVNEVLELIKNNKGLAVLAHPSTIEGHFNVEDIIKKGFDGIEAFYPTHTNSKVRKYLEIARKYDLIVTAGTDYHGPGTERETMAYYVYDDKFLNTERLFV